MCPFKEEIADLFKTYPCLTAEYEQKGEVTISGTLAINVEYEKTGEVFEDEFTIKIVIPVDYPRKLPIVYETSGKIPSNFDHVNGDKTLCLAIPFEQRRFFKKQPNLKGFVENLVVPFLFGFCFWAKHGEYPFGEARHGANGIWDFYEKLFQSSDKRQLLLGLSSISTKGYRGHYPCPCGSGKVIRQCHKEEVARLGALENKTALLEDLNHLTWRKP